MGLIDLVARRYVSRPSALLEIPNSITALDFDIAVAVKSKQLEDDESKKDEKRASGKSFKTGIDGIHNLLNKRNR